MGNVVEDEDKPLTVEQKNLIADGRVAGSVAGMALPILYLLTATITGPLAPAVLMIGILSYTTLLGVTALVGSFMGKKIATRYIRRATPVPIVMEQNTKIDDLFKTLDDHSKNEISAVHKNNRVTPVAISSSVYLTSSFSGASLSREEKEKEEEIKFDSQQIAPQISSDLAPTSRRSASSTTKKRQLWLDGLQKRSAATPAPVINGALAPQISSDLAPTSRRSPSSTARKRQQWLDGLQRSAATPAPVIDGTLAPQISSNRKPH